jgi:hypothetical protein
LGAPHSEPHSAGPVQAELVAQPAQDAFDFPGRVLARLVWQDAPRLGSHSVAVAVLLELAVPPAPDGFGFPDKPAVARVR